MRLPLKKNRRLARLRTNEKKKRVNETAFEKIIDLHEKEQMRRRKGSMRLPFERNRRLARKRANEEEKRVNETAFEKNCRLARK